MTPIVEQAKARGPVAASALILLLLLVCSCSRRNEIVVGTKNFTEQYVLGEIAAQQIERKLHVTVRRRFGLGGTLLAQQALKDGDIDLYPEYTGTAASVVLKINVPSDPIHVYNDVKTAYLSRYHLVWLPPLGFNNTFAMIVRSSDARNLPAANLTAARLRAWRLGIGYEFLTRPDGLQRLDNVYRLRWNGNPKSMDLGLLYRALKQDQVDMAAGNSTDAQLTDNQFTVLADDKHAFPPYDACYVVRENLIQEQPAVAAALHELDNRISEAAMRDLNRRVEIDHAQIASVARDFLAQLH